MTLTEDNSHKMASSYRPPGRLGNPDLSLATDPRVDGKLRPFLKATGMDQNIPPSRISPASGMELVQKMVTKADRMSVQTYEVLPCDLPGDEARRSKLTRKDITIKGVDDNDVKLHVFRRADSADQKLPCVVYIHGGGMVTNTTLNKVHTHWCEDIALSNAVVVAIDFRNAFIPNGQGGGTHHPFPAGLNDCAAGLQWIASHKSELNIDTIVIQGESGGANLSIATAIKAQREGWVAAIDGVYACVPYVSCGWDWSEERRMKELPSTIENNGYFLHTSSMACMGHYYTPEEADKTNPLAWPYHATTEDLKGLPPFILAMDELDPLRDEGIAFGKKLTESGVSVTSSVNLGVIHASSLIFRQALPALHFTTISNIVAFARRLSDKTREPKPLSAKLA